MPNPLKPPKMQKVKSPILESMKSSPGGPHTPGEKAKRAAANDFDQSKVKKNPK